jgi:hypothetical protein
MNSELRGLLTQAGVPTTVTWRDLVVQYNYAPLPRPPVRAHHTDWNRGFTLAILIDGTPKYFAKCRPPDDPVLQWETTIRSCLAGDRRGGVSVAPIVTAASDRMVVQVSPFLLGPHYGQIVTGQSSADYIATLRSVLVGAAELATIAVRECDRLRDSTGSIALRTEAAAAVADVSKLAKLNEYESAALVSAVADAGDVPSRPQHGDFWFQNLIMVDGHLWAIDFDSYGDLRVPMFDDMTLLLTTIGLRAGGAVEGLERLISADAEAHACRDLLRERAAAEGLSPGQLNGLLVFYLATIASTVHRRGGIGFADPHLAAVRHAAQRLASGIRLLSGD